MIIILMAIIWVATLIVIGVVIGKAIAKYLNSRIGVSAEKLYKELVSKYGIVEK